MRIFQICHPPSTSILTNPSQSRYRLQQPHHRQREKTLAPSRLPASSQNSGPATPVVGLLPNTSIEPITLTSTAEKPKPKRIAKEVARLNAARLLDSNGLPALVKIAKSINLKGKKHEFEDLQHILFPISKVGSFLSSTSLFSALLWTLPKRFVVKGTLRFV
ncbi:hypothetical protein BDR26DRAFT_194402 [Obelidium mucronatum]|nr:hypothetical protein BDR26DRAFT_194402 [Obelidium mucronatum]